MQRTATIRFARRHGAVCAIMLVAMAVAAPWMWAADEPVSTQAKPERKLVAPQNWPKGHPLPQIASNCAACHLTAGRELTDAVVHYVRSVHDLQDLTCYDCHGGNRENDVRAHEEEFGFIGTKISAHLARCSECHVGEAEALAAGSHHWDFSKRVNLEYPTCVDCHGNHDIGNPPADFKLTAVCQDCHETLEKDFPHLAGVVSRSDRLADTLRKVREKTARLPEPVPSKFQKDVAALREATMKAIHASKELSADDATKLNAQNDRLRTALEAWLKAKP